MEEFDILIIPNSKENLEKILEINYQTYPYFKYWICGGEVILDEKKFPVIITIDSNFLGFEKILNKIETDIVLLKKNNQTFIYEKGKEKSKDFVFKKTTNLIKQFPTYGYYFTYYHNTLKAIGGW